MESFKSFIPSILAIAFISIVLGAGVAGIHQVMLSSVPYKVDPGVQGDYSAGYIRIWDEMTDGVVSVSSTPTTISLSQNGRRWNMTAFTVSNLDDTDNIEIALGSGVLGELSGDNPVEEIVANETYKITMVSTSGVSRDSVVVVHSSADNSVLLEGVVVSRTSTELIIRHIDSNSPESATSDDYIAGLNHNSFTAGTGIIVFPETISRPIKPLNQDVLLIRGPVGGANVQISRTN